MFLFKQKKWVPGFVFWLFLNSSLNFNKNKFLNFVELHCYNNINFWKLTSCLNNLKWNLFVWLLLIIFLKKLLNSFSKTPANLIIVMGVLLLVLVPDFSNSLYGTNFFFKKLNLALLNGVVNIHPWLTFISYSFLGWVLLVSIKLKTSRKNFINFFFKKNSLKFGTTYIISLSILLGGYWSFQELSWGGWWNWDVVELVSLNFFFVIAAITHFQFFQFFKKKDLFFKIFLIILITSIVVRLNLLSSIHAFINPTANKLVLLKVTLVFILSVCFIKIFLKKTGNKLNKNKSSLLYFNSGITIIVLYVIYYIGVVFMFGEDNVEWSPIIIFLFLSTMIFFINHFLSLKYLMGCLQIWPLNYLVFLTKLVQLNPMIGKQGLNWIRRVHINMVVFMLILFFIKIYAIGFNYLHEIFFFVNLNGLTTHYLGNNFLKKLSCLGGFINILGLELYRNVEYNIFSISGGCSTHFWKNSVYLYQISCIKVMFLNKSVVSLLYSSFLLLLPILFLFFFKKNNKVIKIN